MKTPKLLLVEDDEAALFGYTKYLTKSGYTTKTAASLSEAKDAVESEIFDAVLLDLNLPDGNGIDWITELRSNFENLAIIVITGNTDIPTAVKAMQFGADNFLTKPVNMDDLDISLRKSLEVEDLRKRNSIHQRLFTQKSQAYFGNSDIIQKTLEHTTVAASNNTVVLINGETGTGKGVLARWIHEHSQRKSEAFVELNCSTLKGELLRSELFGHARGAFTSAVKDRLGLVEAADGGSLFLDEIGDMDLEVQTQLLKTLEEKTYRRIGENKLRTSDFRLICATNHDLAEATKNGKFRSDLYYRICVFPITLPPLRERKKDLAGLIEHLLNSFNYKQFPLTDKLMDMLIKYPWPGNIRELRNMLERALLLAQGNELQINHFPGLESIPNPSPNPGGTWDLDKVEEMHILKALKHFDNDKYKASEELGISLSSLYRKLEKMKNNS